MNTDTEDLLLIPGPTQVLPEVRSAVSRQMINHRGPSFTRLYQEIQQGLKPVFGSAEDILIFPSAGTGVMESAVVNLFSPGDRVLVGVMGEFGERFAKIAETFGLQVDRLSVPAGEAVTAGQVAERMEQAGAGAYKAVLVTHNETSTGVTLDLKAVAAAAKTRGALLVVDAVSSLGGIEVRCDEWGVDVLVTSSQKALMTPPGLGLAYVAPSAWPVVEQARLPRFYWDYRKARASGAKGQTPYTPAVGLWFGLREALRLIHAEGLENVYRRHRAMARAFRAGVRALGLELLALEACASPVVTAVKVPEGVDASRLSKTLREVHHVIVAGGQGALQGKIFRVAHMGAARSEQLFTALEAIEEALADQGFPVPQGAGSKAAREVYAAREEMVR